MNFQNFRAVVIVISLILCSLIFIPLETSEADSGEHDVVINELMYDPLGSDSGNEWIELYNNGSAAVNITGWVITDQDGGDDFTFPSLSFPPGNYIVITSGSGTNDTDFSDGCAYFFMWKSGTFFENSGDDILLSNSTGYGIDYVAYDYGTYVDLWPLELDWDDMNYWVDDEGYSLSLHPNGIDTDSGLTWEESDPTPGRANAHIDDDPPTISNIQQTPINPSTSENVTITCNVTDDWLLDSVTLNYNINSTGFSSMAMNFDGINFSAQFPEQIEGTIVEYFISAEDDAEQTSSSLTCSYAHTDLGINVVINEFVADPETDWNGDGYIDSEDEWIELYNCQDTIINMGGWQIDDALGSVGSSDPYTIPSGYALPPKGYLVLYGNETDILLNNNGDNVTLLNEQDIIVDVHSFSGSSDDTGCGRFPDGSNDWKDFLSPTPGAANLYPVDSLGNLSNIVINEFLPAPKDVFKTEWIELYNTGTNSVNLDGCLLDDDISGGSRPWLIPLNTTILPGGILYFNRSFGLNNDGDSVNLVYADGTTVIDSFPYNFCEYDISFGRVVNGEDNWATFSNPTPNQPNTPYLEPDSYSRSVMISELFYKAREEDEFICLHNPSGSAVDISNWRIIDGNHSYSGSIIFPESTSVPPSGQLYVANNAVIFRTIMGFYPDFEYGNSSYAVPDMISREKPGFALGRDEVMLLDSFGNLIDIIIYGDSEYSGSGWSGIPVSDAKKGEVLKRNFNEESRNYEDTNTSLDWKHMRHYKLGQSDFEYETFAYSGSMTLFASPDSSYVTIINEIEGAQSSIYISLYEFTNLNLSQKIIEKLNDGIQVTILMEGGPVEGIQEHEKYILQRLFESGAEIHFLVANATLSSRYRYIHAKYAIIDNMSVIISSENWKYTGIPVNNTYGNRGWGVVVRNAGVAGYFADVFFSDLNAVSYDTFPFIPDHPTYGNASSDFIVKDWIETDNYIPIFPSQTLEGEFKVSPVLSPDTSLLENDAILGLINSAEESIYTEQLDLRLNWDDGDIEYDNKYLKAAIEAAEERHVDVRILLASRYAFSDDPKLDNYDTYVYINDYAKNHNITDYLEARLADCDRLGLSKIHNKGMVVDGNRTLISSINWNRNSVTQNREVGVIIENEDVASYFTQIFFCDWNEPPLANCGEDISVTVSENVQFSDYSQDSDDNIEGYFWDFDDGTNSTEQNPVHTFKEEGMYEVVLTISDGQYDDSCTITVVVHSPEEGESDLGAILYISLMIIFIVIIIIIVIFIRRMRELFI